MSHTIAKSGIEYDTFQCRYSHQSRLGTRLIQKSEVSLSLFSNSKLIVKRVPIATMLEEGNLRGDGGDRAGETMDHPKGALMLTR